MNILGISALYHDSSAALVQNGQVVAAAQEERFNRKKNTEEFPIEAINYCIQEGNILFDDLEAIAFFEKPFLKFSRYLFDHLETWPLSLQTFLKKTPHWLEERLNIHELIEDKLAYTGKIYFIKHHLSHASAAFLPSPFESAAIMTIDGVGEWATTTIGRGQGSQIQITKEIHYPHSLGLLYTTVTTYLGFGANGEEGKTMGLAALGEPCYFNHFKKILHQYENGSFRLDMSYFAFQHKNRMWSSKWVKMFGPPRPAGTPFTQHHKNIAASLQKIIEETVIKIARLHQKETGEKNLCLAGGVTLNCLLNAKILEQTDFENIFIQPAAGDAGGSLGAALYAANCLHHVPRKYTMTSASLGPEFHDREIERALRASDLTFKKIEDEDELLSHVAHLLTENKIVGWFQGRMEFGPRALGRRSILASPLSAAMKDTLNHRIKEREDFQPFAPIVPQELASKYFETMSPSPFMLLTAKAHEHTRIKAPAIVHHDGTSRLQTLEQSENARLHRLLMKFGEVTGTPILINTSFNGRGEPLVCHPNEAIACFLKNHLDVLVLNNYFVHARSS